MKKEQKHEEGMEVLRVPAPLDDESLSSITGGCGGMEVNCTCGIVPENQ